MRKYQIIYLCVYVYLQTERERERERERGGERDSERERGRQVTKRSRDEIPRQVQAQYLREKLAKNQVLAPVVEELDKGLKRLRAIVILIGPETLFK